MVSCCSGVEDLRELQIRGLLCGVSYVSAYEAASDYYEKHKNLLVEAAEGHRQLDLPCWICELPRSIPERDYDGYRYVQSVR